MSRSLPRVARPIAASSISADALTWVAMAAILIYSPEMLFGWAT